LPNQAEKIDTEQDLGRSFKGTQRLRSCTCTVANFGCKNVHKFIYAHAKIGLLASGRLLYVFLLRHQ